MPYLNILLSEITGRPLDFPHFLNIFSIMKPTSSLSPRLFIQRLFVLLALFNLLNNNALAQQGSPGAFTFGAPVLDDPATHNIVVPLSRVDISLFTFFNFFPFSTKSLW